MATKSAKRPALEILPPTISPDVGIRLLSRQIGKGRELLDSAPISEEAFNGWRAVSEEIVVKAFGRSSSKHQRFNSAGRSMMVAVGHQPPSYYENRRRQQLAAKVSELSAFVSVLELEVEITAPSREHHVASIPEAENTSDVFIVHGHDVTARDALARFVEKLGLRAVILHEQPNKGRTIIEKFTENANVGFAVVLLTPDDRGGPAGDAPTSQRFRARQNVILELGFFLGKLGRHRVCALYRKGVEIPSDYSGVVFIELDDAGAWRLLLARELRSAGFEIDMNRVA
jgi:predicted nucleotide-binding protein